MLNALKHALGRRHQSGSLPIAGFLELQALLLKGGFQLPAFFIQLFDVLREIREVAAKILKLINDIIKIPVAFIRRIGHVQIVHRRLAEQQDLGIKLSSALGTHQSTRLILECFLHLIHHLINGGDGLDDAGLFCGVIDLQIAHDIDEHLEIFTSLGDFCVQLLGFSHFRDILHLAALCIRAFAIGIQRLGLQKELHALLRKRLRLFIHLR